MRGEENICLALYLKGNEKQKPYVLSITVVKFYLHICFRGNIKQRDDIFRLIKREFSIMKESINEDPYDSANKAFVAKVADKYHVEAIGASVTAGSSVNIIYRYCATLPGDKY